MIDYELFVRIHDYHENRHLTVRQIAQKLGLHPWTVKRWLGRKKYGPRGTPLRASKRDGSVESRPGSSIKSPDHQRREGGGQAWCELSEFRGAAAGQTAKHISRAGGSACCFDAYVFGGRVPKTEAAAR